MSSAACQPRDHGPFRVDIPRIFCKNAVVCRESVPANQFHYDYSYPREGVCIRCAVSAHGVLDIIECADECPACYRPMNFGVRGKSCAHRTCPWCAHYALFGFPRPTYETFATDHNPYDPLSIWRRSWTRLYPRRRARELRVSERLLRTGSRRRRPGQAARPRRRRRRGI
jgi:hypothetical protein